MTIPWGSILSSPLTVRVSQGEHTSGPLLTVTVNILLALPEDMSVRPAYPSPTQRDTCSGTLRGRRKLRRRPSSVCWICAAGPWRPAFSFALLAGCRLSLHGTLDFLCFGFFVLHVIAPIR